MSTDARRWGVRCGGDGESVRVRISTVRGESDDGARATAR